MIRASCSHWPVTGRRRLTARYPKPRFISISHHVILTTSYAFLCSLLHLSLLLIHRKRVLHMSSVRSPDGGLNTRDPFDLNRLAEELATRELTSPPADGQFTLPFSVPLSHDNPYLSAETFDVEAFLLSRSYTSLPDLRTELRDYLAQLKEELVKLINDDYEAFISLSTDLRGEGTRMEKLKAPLGDMKAAVLVRLCSSAPRAEAAVLISIIK